MRDIAVLVGYSDEYYFSRKFKKEVGLTPYMLTQIRPDAIIGTDGMDSAEKARLASIAPTCFIPADLVGWKEQLR